MRAKEVRCDVVNVDIYSKPEWLLEINKSGKVPVLEMDGDKILTESIIIAEYFDEQYEESRKLQPNDVYEKCRQKMLCESISPLFPTFGKIIHTTEPLSVLMNNVESGLRTIEMELKSRATQFIGGNDHPSLVDYLIWPLIERLPAAIAIIRKDRNWQKYLAFNYPLLVKYMLQMYEDKVVKSVAHSDQIHEEYLLFAMKLIRGEAK
ncbi:hypothetical protein B4U80_05252 [Leptotrombidium deliense]|uniref:Uncharacterized protein n=1 Tax=Leptotrombidium deliense TaxID=299467 RepID=A0A443RWE3_9ACAR|nr:hypothetical protein B4U80_05252 [Leptotrombidium deliense]